MKKTIKGRKSFFDLSPAERDRDVARFDQPIDIEKDTKPMTAKQQAIFKIWQKGAVSNGATKSALKHKGQARFDKARADRPHISISVSNGNQDVKIELDDDLWAKATAFAKKNKTTLPKMINRSLRGLLAFVD